MSSLLNFGLTMSELTIDLYSFGYKFSGIPEDFTDNNGGFVIDCRFLPNPGRELEYFELTGKDNEVVEYLQRFPQVEQFFGNVKSIIDMAVANYIQRDFTHLMISFGCTGGQHRSVYFAEQMNKFLKSKPVSVNLVHLEQDF